MVTNNAKGAVRFAIALMWWISALLPLIPSVHQRAMHELSLVGLTGALALAFMGIAMLLDIACGVGALCLHHSWVWWVQMLVVVVYTVILSVSHAQLWLDPFGALLKNIPIIALMIYMARTERRT
ncbi:MAG: hypothetical protein H6R05_637 [Burkholderiaceae bacterium]|nr:hypothetical protein [Burkholderiaceae bacterium]